MIVQPSQPKDTYEVFHIKDRTSLQEFYEFLSARDLNLDIQPFHTLGRVCRYINMSGIYDCIFSFGDYFFVHTADRHIMFTRETLDGYDIVEI